ncbi:hypothetical protein BDU57DRAFT_554132 [Ampelomyces quisqualis]|uniref:PSI domain-containing protein n=1 Tax=Ampelomyces quisqualis TaxID=50730 RepID=A0A6A5QTE0_AMPQU|nr:hypothetical protein BDU57DRAFT_554132 [Ampelomyces quisqualis]
MASGCPSMSVARANDAYSNVTELLLQRYQDSPKDDLDRLLKCWGYLDCGDCHRSDGFCGWCPISYTCLPLPNDTLSRTFPLLSPMRHRSICALGSERFELRTAGLGCQVSTITFLTCIFTILSTLFVVLVLELISKCVKGIVVGMRARNSGYVVYPNEEEQWTGDLWTRRGEGWGRWWRRMNGDQKELEVEEVDDGSPHETGRNWWGGRKGGQVDVHGEETRPLLDSN